MNRIERTESGHVSYADIRREEDKEKLLYIDYVFSPPELRGTGAAGRVMEDVVALAVAEDRRIVAICSYAAAWLRRRG